MLKGLINEPCITMNHGAGTEASARLIEHCFLKAFGDSGLKQKEDQARFPLNSLTEAGDRLAFTTDSYTVSPLVFPGGDIGKLSVCGTINDLAVGGALPKYLSVGFILEEGLAMSELQAIVDSMATTASQAGVQIVTGDTKVVERGQADKMYINTSGIGVIPAHINLSVSAAKPGDVVIVNGFIGDHGAAILLARGELGIKGALASDCAPLHRLIQSVLEVCPQTRCIRDATRGGVAAVVSEIARASGVSVALSDPHLPIRDETRGICELLGLDPLLLANEGAAIFILPEEHAHAVLEVMQTFPEGQGAALIGRVESSSPTLIYVETDYGSKRMLEIPYGIQLPRIC